MEYDDFRNILTSFADRPADVNLERGRLMVEIRDDLIDASLYSRGGDLVVEENGVRQSARDWMFGRIARMPILADRILTQIPDEENFIEPSGFLLDRMENSPDDAESELAEVIGPILRLLDERLAGISTGVYLTSDAGEGKTTLIHHLARHQARQYKNKETDWLLVPIALGGRPFLRFDDVVIGTLVNTLRFPFLYYDAFVWLVRMGVIVPALDGFEEMFVEGHAGDAVSALGNLMQLLDSRGTILIAARDAYFEYKSLGVQAPLFDSIRGENADFARIKLSRWNQKQFINYAERRHVIDGPGLFREVANELNDEYHPLLTRAVLVKRLIDVASDHATRTDVIQNIGLDNGHVFERFVDSIVRREAREKWIDRSGSPARPLLTEEQHHALLAEIAMEMWVSETAALKADVFDYVVDLYTESCGMDSRMTNQIRDRIRQHALIVRSGSIRDAFSFDHDEFYHYFLGEAIGRMIAKRDPIEIRRAFRIAAFPRLALAVAAEQAVKGRSERSYAVGTLNVVCASEPHASFVKDNSGSLVAQLIDGASDDEEVVVHRMSFPADALRKRTIERTRFRECYFRRTTLGGTTVRGCVFEQCQFEQLDLSEVGSVEGSSMRDCEVVSIVRSVEGSAIFVPEVIYRSLKNEGFDVLVEAHEVKGEIVDEIEMDERLVLTERMCRSFFRSTGVNEYTFRQRLGKEANLFFDQVLPELVSHSVVKEVEYRGSGQQRRFQLGVSLGDVQQSIEHANGCFDKFLNGIAR